MTGIHVPISHRRWTWQMEEARLYVQAVGSQQHADWYCSLPWPRMWVALVTGR